MQVASAIAIVSMLGGVGLARAADSPSSHGAATAIQPVKSSASSASCPNDVKRPTVKVAALFEALPGRYGLGPRTSEALTWQFQIANADRATNADGRSWIVSVTEDVVTVGRGTAEGADATLTGDAWTLAGIMDGSVSGLQAINCEWLTIEGDIAVGKDFLRYFPTTGTAGQGGDAQPDIDVSTLSADEIAELVEAARTAKCQAGKTKAATDIVPAFKALESRYAHGPGATTATTWYIQVTDADERDWTVSVGNGAPRAAPGVPVGPDATLTGEAWAFVAIMDGNMSPQTAIDCEWLTVDGAAGVGLEFLRLFPPTTPK